MVRYALVLTLFLTLIANSMVPQRIQLYPACCSEMSRACCENHCAETAIQSSRSCCQPTIIALHTNQNVQAGNTVEPSFISDVLPPVHPLVIECRAVDSSTVVALNTGPPHTSSLLPLQSRFNL